jgi:Tol biopolymer transport system component
MSIEAYILPPEKMSFTLGGDDASGPVKLSPDGTKIVFVAQDGRSQRQVYVRGIDDKEAKPIPGTENGTYPFWSPDGKNIAFQSNGMLHRVAVNGGPVLDICQSQRFRGGSWGAEGIVFTPDTTTTIFHVAPNAGATPQPVTTLSADHTTHRWPTLLPDGKHFLYLASNHSDPRPNDRNGIYFGSIDGKESHFIVGAHSNAAYANGLLLWEQDGSLLAQKFDAKAGRVSGEVIPLVSGIGYNSSTWRAAFDVNPNGVLVYQPGLSASSGQLMIYDAEGHSKAVADSGAIMDLRLSPDGRRAVVLTRTADHGLWILDLDKGTRTRFTFSSTNDGVVWSPDGKYVYYTPFGKTSRIVRKATDGTGEEATVFESPGPLHVSDISRDGKTILFEQRYGNLSSTTMVLPLSPLGTPRPLSKDPVGTHYARFSPDGKWVIYCTTETSRFEVYIAPLEGGSRQQLSTGGGWGPRWSRDGKSIYYVNGERNLTVLPISIKGNAIEAGQSRLMFVLPALVPTSFFAMSIDASTDGKRFVANVTGENDDESRAILMTNWPAKLKK